MNIKEAKLVWRYMSLIKATQDSDMSTKHLSGVDFKVLAYIGWRCDKAYINEIKQHPAFKPYSLSTLKRAVLNLLSLDLIQSRQSKEDGRVMYLELKEK